MQRVLETLALYKIATGKDLADTLNHFGKQVAIFATYHTDKADKTKLEGQLRKVLGHRIASKSGKRLKKPKPITAPTTLARAIIVSRMRKKGEILTSREIDAQVDRMIKARLIAIGYHKAGWIPALSEFGAPISKAGAKAFGPPAGGASKATESRLSAMLKNFAEKIDIQEAALDKAIREARIDMKTYAKAKLAKREAETNRKINR